MCNVTGSFAASTQARRLSSDAGPAKTPIVIARGSLTSKFATLDLVSDNMIVSQSRCEARVMMIKEGAALDGLRRASERLVWQALRVKRGVHAVLGLFGDPCCVNGRALATNATFQPTICTAFFATDRYITKKEDAGKVALFRS